MRLSSIFAGTTARQSALLLLAIGSFCHMLQAQTTPKPVVLPYIIGTIAGGGAATTAGSACSTGSPYTATNAFGDGCPASQALFSSDIRGGVTTDPLGNVYIADTSNSLVRKVDARSGLITTLAGGGKICSAAVDKGGDGCAAVGTTLLNSPRGIGNDPYGNIFIAGYSDNLVHIVCNTISPLCTPAQVGTMRIAAGCYSTTAAYGTSGNTGDGLTASGACGGTVATVNQPRGVNADRFGNIYLGDTGNSRMRVVVGPVIPGVTNPLIAVLQLYPANASITAASAAGKIYAIAGGTQFTVPAIGATCAAGIALDGTGDGCPFYNTSLSTSGGFVQAVAVDSYGNFFFGDAQTSGRLRVIYAGGTGNPMAHLITVNNPTVITPLQGYAYSLAGGGGTSVTSTPILGSTASLDGNLYRINTDLSGNIYLGDNTAILFVDINTGYIRRIAANNTVCTGANTVGDGCPATQAAFGGSTNVLGLALDNLGNLFFADGTNHTIRKIASTNFTPSALGTTVTRSIFVHAPTGVTSLTPSIAPNTDFTLGTSACTLNTPGDATYDCIVPATFTPTQLGLRDAPIAVQPSLGSTLTASLTETATGTALAFDPTAPATPVTQSIGTLIPTAVATDGHGNLYTVDSTSMRITRISGTTATPISAALNSLPNQIAVDPSGNVYASTGAANLTKLTLTAPTTYTQTTISPAIPSTVTTIAVAVDPNGTTYYADNNSGTVFKSLTSQGNTSSTAVTAPFSVPIALAFDNLGNLLVVDAGVHQVYRVSSSGIRTVVATTNRINPAAVAADSAGNIYIGDYDSGSVFMVPVTGPQVTVATGFTSINGLAVDGAGNLYIATTATTGITEVLRSQFPFNFGSSVSLSLTGTVTNTGNATATSFAQTDTIDFQLTGNGSTCNTATTSILSGAACTLVASFTPAAAGGGSVSDILSFLPAASTLGAVTLSATKAGNLTTTTTSLGSQSPTSPVFSAGGAAVTFAATVTASTGTAGGNLSVTLDGGTATTYTLSATGTASISLTGLAAGSHTIAASYPSQAGISGSTSTPLTFTVAQATTTVSWTPTTLSRQYSQAIGTGVFNATSNGIAGAFVYTATPATGAAVSVDSSTYLPIGTYALAVTFTPTDAIDYKASTASVPSFTIVKATTTAAIGASQNVVAADGSGNYTNITAAVAALPTTGGNIYIRPGTYNEQFTISYPNVSLRGLGGVAQNVILTAEHGAFSNPLPPGVTAGNNGAQGDQGSATVVVDKQTINGTVFTPNFFYAENLSIFNTYNTDSTNQNTLAVVNGTCTAGQAAQSNFALYNAGTLCASQALALWTRSDKSVLNNVRLNSLQDTLYAGSQGCGATCVPARLYFFNGYIAGDVDYIFGDAAAVFDHTTFFTAYHGATATGTETIEAQNKASRTGSSTDYLSGYILSSANLTSQSPGMTNLYYGRPYGQYSTFILLNSTVDQVNPVGFIEFSGQSNLPTSTYAEFNTLGAGGTSASLAGRETISLRPNILTAAQAAQYAPVTFLSTPAPDSWNPADALTANVNAFVPTTTTFTILANQSITILARPQTPGGGAVPTGAYTLTDGSTVLASGNLDLSGAVYLTTSALTPGPHSITFAYAGDTNFSASTSTTPLTVTVGGTTSAITASPNTPVYGTPVTVSYTLTQNAPTTAPTGTVSLVVDSANPIMTTLASSAATFTLTNLSAGSHTLTATYSGDASNGASSATTTVAVTKATLTLAAPTLTIVFSAPIPALTPTYTGFINGDTAATALSGVPVLALTPAVPTTTGSYPIIAAPGTLTAANYTFNFVSGLLTISKASTSTALATSNASPGQGNPVTFTATIASTAKGTPTGSISFYTGTTLLNTITLTSSGTAAYATSFSAQGSTAVTAVYSGDQSFLTSSSAAASEAVVPSSFTITSAPSSLSVARGASGMLALTATPTGNYQGSATFACANLPSEATCTFSPQTIVFNGSNTPVTTQLTFTAATAITASARTARRSSDRTFLAGIFLFPSLLLLGALRRRRAAGIYPLLSLTLLAACLTALSGCGSSTSTKLSPAGTTAVIISANSLNATGGNTQQTSVIVTITQ